MSLPFELISTDFDGTIFAEFENPPIALEFQDLIGSLQRQGVKWVINTGRDMSSLMEALGRAHISIEPDFLVLVEREIHWHHDSQYVAHEQWNAACAQCHGELFETIKSALPGIVAWINARYHARIYEDPYSPFCLITATNEEMDVIHQFLDEFCATVPGLTVVRNDVYARFSHQAYNKGTALSELARRLKIGPEKILAAGDHLNDLPMLSRDYAHFICAPANAVPVVKAQVVKEGGFVGTRSQGWGVSDGIKFYLRKLMEGQN